MPTIIFEDEEIEFDKYGYLVDFSKWTRKLAVKMAWEDGFKTLGDDERHWLVMEFLRDLHKKDMLPSSDAEILYLITKGAGLSIARLHRIFSGLSIPRLLKWAGLPPIVCSSGV
jgi:sulfur relay (sulfurtransferase) DsrC/TusE family protein